MFGQWQGGRVLLRLPASDELPVRAWIPAADIHQIESGWIVKLELAGVRQQDIAIAIEGSILRVRGQRRDWIAHESRRCKSLEITYDHFERSFEFPERIDAGRVLTDYRDGMLLIKIVTEEATP